MEGRREEEEEEGRAKGGEGRAEGRREEEGRKEEREGDKGKREGRKRKRGDLYPNIPYDRMEGYGRADWKGGKRCLALNPSLYPIEGRKGRGKGKREEREGRKEGRTGRGQGKRGREGDKGREHWKGSRGRD